MKDQMPEDFVKAVRAKVGPTYDLSQVVYLHSRKKVHVICPKHGDVYPEASELLQGHVCRACGNEKRRKPMAVFKAEATALHGGRYNYDHLVEVKNNREKFTLVCPDHGSFQTNMLKHSQGQACPKCGIARRSAGRLNSQEKAIATLEAAALGDYDFSEFVFTGTQKKGWVTCRKHQHRFEMTYANLTQGHGCPKCGHERNAAGATARGTAGMRSLAGAKWTVNTPEGVVKAGSSWEVLVYRWLTTRYPNTKTQLYIKTHLGGYMPDFYIPERDLYVEVKGREITVGQEAKRATLSNVAHIHPADMLTIFSKHWYTPPAWGRELDQTQRNEKLNAADLGVLPDVDEWLRSKGF
jgi:hypothetical protein